MLQAAVDSGIVNEESRQRLAGSAVRKTQTTTKADVTWSDTDEEKEEEVPASRSSAGSQDAEWNGLFPPQAESAKAPRKPSRQSMPDLTFQRSQTHRARRSYSSLTRRPSANSVRKTVYTVPPDHFV